MNSLRHTVLPSIFCALIASAARGGEVSFSRDIRPILSQHCFKCHGQDQQKSNLRLDDQLSVMRAAKSGKPAIVASRPGESELLRRVASDDPDESMPPPKSNISRLSQDDVDKLHQWITAGARYEKHWAYVKPARPPVPQGANPIDYFIGKKLQESHLSPSPQADPFTLCRRLCLDLTGLPPTPEEADAFVQAVDGAPEAYRAFVDKLLASDRFGEKWARGWLDLARYGDSAGYQHDLDMPLWLFRDWVIRALNADMPFDQFTTEQLAGDLLPNATLQQRIATGFSRCGTATLGADQDAEDLRAQFLWDRVSTFGTTWLGTSLECAQCHNHKFDPFTQRDYYGIYAFFNGTADELTFHFGDHYYITGGVLEMPAPPQQIAETRRIGAEIVAEFDRVIPISKKHREETLPPTIRRLLISPAESRTADRIAYLITDELKPEQKLPDDIAPHIERIRALARELERTRPARSLVLQDDAQPRATRVLLRGNTKTPGEASPPATPQALQAANVMPRDRLDLARWVVSPDNPLTARVAVNRWWAELFGQGIVATPEDFGLQGEFPTHQDLLDWLACEFMEHGWSMKHVLGLMVTSRTYQQTSRGAAPIADPQNKLLSRGPRFRLDAETVRDNALAIAGLLHHEIGGKPVPATREEAPKDGPFAHRRSVYLRQQRGAPYATLGAFDAPDRFACTAKRARSNSPLQALTLMNEPVFVEAALALAASVSAAPSGGGDRDRVALLFRRCVTRPPADRELAELLRLLSTARQRDGDEAAWLAVANAVLNLDETITKE